MKVTVYIDKEGNARYCESIPISWADAESAPRNVTMDIVMPDKYPAAIQACKDNSIPFLPEYITAVLSHLPNPIECDYFYSFEWLGVESMYDKIQQKISPEENGAQLWPNDDLLSMQNKELAIQNLKLLSKIERLELELSNYKK